MSSDSPSGLHELPTCKSPCYLSFSLYTYIFLVLFYQQYHISITAIPNSILYVFVFLKTLFSTAVFLCFLSLFLFIWSQSIREERWFTMPVHETPSCCSIHLRRKGKTCNFSQSGSPPFFSFSHFLCCVFPWEKFSSVTKFYWIDTHIYQHLWIANKIYE